MRYFTKDLWKKVNEQDELVRIQAEQEWNINSLNYQQQWETVKKHLPRSFVKNFLNCKGLHDYIVLGVSFTKRGRAYSCRLQLTNGFEKVLVTMYKLKVLQIDVASLQNCIQGNLTWGYSEFEIMSDNYIQLAVLCDMQNEMTFQFKSITISK